MGCLVLYCSREYYIIYKLRTLQQWEMNTGPSGVALI